MNWRATAAGRPGGRGMGASRLGQNRGVTDPSPPSPPILLHPHVPRAGMGWLDDAQVEVWNRAGIEDQPRIQQRAWVSRGRAALASRHGRTMAVGGGRAGAGRCARQVIDDVGSSDVLGADSAVESCRAAGNPGGGLRRCARGWACLACANWGSLGAANSIVPGQTSPDTDASRPFLPSLTNKTIAPETTQIRKYRIKLLGHLKFRKVSVLYGRPHKPSTPSTPLPKERYHRGLSNGFHAGLGQQLQRYGASRLFFGKTTGKKRTVTRYRK